LLPARITALARPPPARLRAKASQSSWRTYAWIARHRRVATRRFPARRTTSISRRSLRKRSSGQIQDTGGRAHAVELDLSLPQKIPELFERAESAFGRVEVLVNNAAYCRSDTFVPDSEVAAMMRDQQREWADYGQHQVTADSHDLHFAVNSRAVALTMAEFSWRHVEAKALWGRIINISTDAASAHPTEVSYGASKFAMESYSHAAAAELARYGITVNIVAPGPIQTGYIPPDVESGLTRRIPLGRVGQPEDIADAIVLLASEQARWITGQKIYVGGGNKMPL